MTHLVLKSIKFTSCSCKCLVNVWAFIVNFNTWLCVSHSHVHTHAVCGWCAVAASRLICFTVALLYFSTFVYHAVSREQTAREGKKPTCNISVWLMWRHARECWGALKLKSDARLSTQLDFKAAGSVSEMLLRLWNWVRQEESMPHNDVLWMKTGADLNTLYRDLICLILV